MKLHEILSNPAIMAHIRTRGCGDAGFPLCSPVKLRPIAEKWKREQVTNTGPATTERQRPKAEKAPGGNDVAE